MQPLRFVVFAAIMCLLMSARISAQRLEMSTEDDGTGNVCLMVPDQMMGMMDTVCNFMNLG
ncbi:unnamed protein product [Larinioides sclopetarius]|uniref:Uncharacterized protein n=1 Tax=Larinioides sclopetarius TaxID=280406 RepID=A0AAV2AI35_9ARAC